MNRNIIQPRLSQRVGAAFNSPRGVYVWARIELAVVALFAAAMGWLASGQHHDAEINRLESEITRRDWVIRESAEGFRVNKCVARTCPNDWMGCPPETVEACRAEVKAEVEKALAP